jgi:hypothetical protein
MSKLDSAKEEVGWLKLLFAVAVAIDTSLVAWVAQAHDTARPVLVTMAVIGIVALSATAYWINRSAYRRIRELERL